MAACPEMRSNWVDRHAACSCRIQDLAWCLHVRVSACLRVLMLVYTLLANWMVKKLIKRVNWPHCETFAEMSLILISKREFWWEEYSIALKFSNDWSTRYFSVHPGLVKSKKVILSSDVWLLVQIILNSIEKSIKFCFFFLISKCSKSNGKKGKSTLTTGVGSED